MSLLISAVLSAMLNHTDCRSAVLVNPVQPLFASTPKERGGLSLTASQVAGPLAFSGAVFLVYAGFG